MEQLVIALRKLKEKASVHLPMSQVARGSGGPEKRPMTPSRSRPPIQDCISQISYLSLLIEARDRRGFEWLGLQGTLIGKRVTLLKAH